MIPTKKDGAIDQILGPISTPYDADFAPGDADLVNGVKTLSLEQLQNVRIHTPPLIYDVANLPQEVQFSVSGAGCATLQVRH